MCQVHRVELAGGVYFAVSESTFEKIWWRCPMLPSTVRHNDSTPFFLINFIQYSRVQLRTEAALCYLKLHSQSREEEDLEIWLEHMAGLQVDIVVSRWTNRLFMIILNIFEVLPQLNRKSKSANAYSEFFPFFIYPKSHDCYRSYNNGVWTRRVWYQQNYFV